MNHYMPSALLDSQLACLDLPAADKRVITIGVGARPAEIVAEIIRRVELRPRTVLIRVRCIGSRLLVGTSAGRLVEFGAQRRVTVTGPPLPACLRRHQRTPHRRRFRYRRGPEDAGHAANKQTASASTVGFGVS